MRARVLAAWSASPSRFREDANAEEDLVLGGYRDRVLIELAQNAADAATRAGVAGRVRFNLEGDVLRVANTGSPIDGAGVESASTLRASSKRDEMAGAEVVGRFGVGFAAALAVSDEPAIVSRGATVGWSRQRTLDEAAAVPSLGEELRRRGQAVPVLRLPFTDLQLPAPPSGFDTEVVLPLRDAAARQLVAGLLVDLDASLLLTLPALTSFEVILDGRTRELAASPVDDGVVIDGVRWRRHTSSGPIDPGLLRDRPVEERTQRTFSVTWAIPLDEAGRPTALPKSVAAVIHAPTPTDEPLSLPALLIAALPLDPSRRHVAEGGLRDELFDQAALAYVELVRELPAAEAILGLVPIGVATGAADGELRTRILALLRDAAIMPARDGGPRLRPQDSVLLDVGASSTDDLDQLLFEVLPRLVPLGWQRLHARALAALEVPVLTIGDLLDDLAGVDRPPAWWRSLYAALTTAGISIDSLAGLPVPLATGSLARSARGLLMPGQLKGLEILGFRLIDADAAHPLLLRLGAVEAEPRALLADERTRAVVENSLDADDPGAVAEIVLALVEAARLTPGDEPMLAALALPDSEGEWYAAEELLLPRGILAGLVVDDAPFGILAESYVDRWGAAVVTAAGVLDSFGVVREADVMTPDHDLDGEDDYLDEVLPDTGEPATVTELVGVRDLELVRADAWPAALRAMAKPPLRATVVEPAMVTTALSRTRVPSYTAWWLRTHRVVAGRLASSDPILEGLYDVVDIDADDEFLRAVGALDDLAAADPDDVLARLGDPGRALTRTQTKAIYAQVQPAEPVVKVRGLLNGELVTAAAADAAIVDAPDLLPLLGNRVLLPVSLSDAERVADLLDVDLASELASFEVVSDGKPADDHVLHQQLMVTDVDGTACHVAWRLAGGVLHVDAGMAALGLGRGRAWRAGDWSRRQLETELVREPGAVQLLLLETDLD